MLTQILRTTTTLLGTALLAVAGCGSEPPPAVEAGGEEADPTVSLVAPLTPQSAGQELPEGHPPIGDAQGVRAGSPRAGTRLHWTVPDGWAEERPSSSVRLAQYRVPGSAGDAEMVVFYFGAGQGGDARANAVRWAEQFRQPDGRPPTDAMKTEEIDVNDLPVMLVEVTGTYANPMVMDEPQPGAMLLGAIARGPDANWFFKLTGPEATVREQRKPFEGLVRSLHAE